MTDPAGAEALKLARAAAAAAADKKAENILILDLRALSAFADYFVICSGGSERQLGAIADGIDEALQRDLGVRPRSGANNSGGGWVLVDYTDVVVHIFLPSQRQYYNLEALWQQAPAVLRVQ
jgi:ribosome-associated protein